MFIYVVYKDAPELSLIRRKSEEIDTSEEKVLMVNPYCYVRVMLDYIRKECKLAATTQFDLCDESGVLKGLFSYPTYAYVHAEFEDKKTYYLVVLKPNSAISVVRKDLDKISYSIFPQLNRENKLYEELVTKVRRFLAGEKTEPTSEKADKKTKSDASAEKSDKKAKSETFSEKPDKKTKK